MKKWMIGTALALVLGTPALAGSVNLSAELTQINGRPFADPADKLSEPEAKVVSDLTSRGYVLYRPKITTLGDVAVQALLTPVQNEEATEKARKFLLAMKLQKAMDEKVPGNATVDLSLDETKMVNDAIKKNYPPLIMGQAWRLLDPGSMPK